MVVYGSSARYYDTIYSFKNYQADADAIRSLITAHQSRGRESADLLPSTLLDVGCGTGTHLALMQAHYTCEGVEYSQDMLAVAREKLPDLTLHQDDMRTFALGKTFDVVVCLFSAIGYMLTESDLSLAVANMAQHVTPGGLLVVEAWLHPDQYTAGHLSMLTVDRPDIKIARMTRAEAHGHISYMPMHHLITTSEGVEHFVELHELGMYPSAVYERAFEAAGLATTVDASHTLWRTLYVGVKPHRD